MSELLGICQQCGEDFDKDVGRDHTICAPWDHEVPVQCGPIEYYVPRDIAEALATAVGAYREAAMPSCIRFDGESALFAALVVFRKEVPT